MAGRLPCAVKQSAQVVDSSAKKSVFVGHVFVFKVGVRSLTEKLNELASLRAQFAALADGLDFCSKECLILGLHSVRAFRCH
mmetsp:Transcript_9223/g.21831  ORF Transcript_9223/g.21831 Transcript_9223/m.21831 type:complete len:82 (+) Transcript_9223:3958-4203(+)